MCNKILRLKSPPKVSTPLEFKSTVTFTLPVFVFFVFFLGGGVTVIINMIFRRVG